MAWLLLCDASVSQTVCAPLYVQYTVVASLLCEMLDIRPSQGRNILAYHKDVHYHLSCSQSWWPCSSLTRRLNSQWNWNQATLCPSCQWIGLCWWLPRTLVEQKHIWDALKQWEWIMVFASTGRNARYYLLGAKLPSQPLTEVTLHANHPSHILEVIWMPLALVAPKSASDWVKPRVNSTNWRESGGILPCTPNKRSVSSKLVSCQNCCIACTQCGWIRRTYGKLMGFKQSASVLSFISHPRTSVVLQMQRCCREATANACPPSWNSDSYVYFNPLQCYLMMMFADDAFSNLVALFCTTCQLHAAGVAPNKYRLPKYIEWQWKLLKVLTC